MLYFVPTPIGNLEDMTLRSIRILKEVDIIYAEDTRHSLRLLNHFEIKKTLVSYHKFNELYRCEKILEELNSGMNIAVISDAGSPGISDPGATLAKFLAENNAEYTVLPGANAVLPAILLSSIECNRFYFEGFLPRERNDIKERLAQLSKLDASIVIYESPNRIKETLKYIFEAFGERNCAICREISKMHETVYRESLSTMLDILPEKLLGECVIIIEGNTSIQEVEISIILDMMKDMIDGGMRVKDAAKALSSSQFTANELFKYYLERR